MMEQSISSRLKISIADCKPPARLKGKDVRCDPLASASIRCVERLLSESSLMLPETTSVVVITKTGCVSHINKVVEAAQQSRPRQGFFSRGGPQMLANYCSIAFDLHGASYTYFIQQNPDSRTVVENIVNSLVTEKILEQVLLIEADYVGDELVVEAMYLDSCLL
ncbi:hypothetical protein [Pseudoalteromonas sp. MMG022]|uniref:hypothetical protein n=1 Tax=Pseudoalteromonas sp. MMG022 TaxID=2909978 RepID=UPI001F3680B5|nr:hypothetical protein [Pseudoalteromonas sp. MMG022]MCF6436499.1 hypothetical protein [Pseudoalteromonas sp. MMG022]